MKENAEIAKRERQAQKLSRERLSAKAGGTPSASTIRRAEKGDARITAETWEQIAKALGKRFVGGRIVSAPESNGEGSLSDRLLTICVELQRIAAALNCNVGLTDDDVEDVSAQSAPERSQPRQLGDVGKHKEKPKSDHEK